VGAVALTGAISALAMVSEHFVDLVGQSGDGEWLLNEPSDPAGELPGRLALVETTDEYHSHGWMDGNELAKALRAIHVGHRHIEQYAANVGLTLSEDLDQAP
jgi:hypothetical protein